MSPGITDLPIEVLELSARSYNCLKRAGKDTLGDILTLRDEDFLSIRSLGTKCLSEIREKLEPYARGCSTPDSGTDEEIQPFDIASSRPQGDGGHFAGSLLDSPVEALQLSSRACRILKMYGCATVADVLMLGDQGVRWSAGYDDPRAATEIQQRVDALLASHPALSRPVPIAKLNLSARSQHALLRSNVFTINRLAQMSEEEIMAVRNIGVKAVAEIKAALDAFVEAHGEVALQSASDEDTVMPTPLPAREPRRLVDPSVADHLLGRGIPLDAISLHRLAYSSNEQLLLQRAGVETVGELMQQASSAWEAAPQILNRLNQYLNWLEDENEASWAAEASNEGVSPMHLLDLRQVPLAEWAEAWTRGLSGREKKVVRWRYGFDRDLLTLEEVGQHLGVTRERVRQIQQRALRKLQRLYCRDFARPLFEYLKCYLKERSGVVDEHEIGVALNRDFVVGNVDPVGVARLALDLCDEATWHSRAQVWGLTTRPISEIENVQSRLVRVLAKTSAPLPLAEVVEQFKGTTFYRNHQQELDDEFIAACLRVHPEIIADDDQMCALRRWESRRTDEVVMALRDIGRPEHYKIVAQVANIILPEEMRTSAHVIHAILGRRTDLFVRVGHGIFGLKEWGIPQDGSVANAAHRVLAEIGQPLHVEAITDRVLDTWQIARASVLAAILNDERFYRAAPATFGLLEWEIERLDEEEPVLHVCPAPILGVQGDCGLFFESVIVGHELLCAHPTTERFLEAILSWACSDIERSERYLQNVLNAYYIVGLVPYSVYRLAHDVSISSTLHETNDLRTVRTFCLSMMMARLARMSSFMGLLLTRQPCTRAELQRWFYEPEAPRNDVKNRLEILQGLGILIVEPSGSYRLSPFGIAAAQNLVAEGRLEFPSKSDTSGGIEDEAQSHSFTFDAIDFDLL